MFAVVFQSIFSENNTWPFHRYSPDPLFNAKTKLMGSDNHSEPVLNFGEWLFLLTQTENAQSLCKGKYHCSADFQFNWFGFNVTKLLNPNKQKRRSADISPYRLSEYYMTQTSSNGQLLFIIHQDGDSTDKVSWLDSTAYTDGTEKATFRPGYKLCWICRLKYYCCLVEGRTKADFY